MNPHSYHRKRSGKKRGHYRICKYCFGTPLRDQGLCHECSQRSKEENKRRLVIVNAMATLDHFLTQKNISAKNLKTIKSFCDLEDPALHEYATLVLAIGQKFPRKKKRYRKIRRINPELYRRIRQNSKFFWHVDESIFECYQLQIEPWPDEYFSQRLADEEAFEFDRSKKTVY